MSKPNGKRAGNKRKAGKAKQATRLKAIVAYMQFQTNYVNQLHETNMRKMGQHVSTWYEVG